MKILNYTPHDIVLQTESGERTVFPSVGIARVKEEIQETHQMFGVPVVLSRMSEIYGLPEPQEGVYYIVSNPVLDRAVAGGRAFGDLLAPYTGMDEKLGPIREHGLVVAARALRAGEPVPVCFITRRSSAILSLSIQVSDSKVKNGEVEDGLDYLYETFDDYLKEGHFQDVDTTLLSLLEEGLIDMSSDIMIGILVNTWPAKGYLNQRRAFYDAVEATLRKRGEYKPSLLAHLD